jgi:hypothetical protein
MKLKAPPENRLTLSPTMVEAMDYAKRVGGVLHRYRGVCWSRPGAITDRGFPVVDRIPNPTVGALLKRGWLRVMMSAGTGRLRRPVKVVVARRWPPSDRWRKIWTPGTQRSTKR